MTYHTGIHDLVKGKLANNQLASHAAYLEKEFTRRLDELNLHGKL